MNATIKKLVILAVLCSAVSGYAMPEQNRVIKRIMIQCYFRMVFPIWP